MTLTWRLYAALALVLALFGAGVFVGWKAHAPAVTRAERKLAEAEAQFAVAKATAEAEKVAAENAAAKAVEAANQRAAQQIEVVRWRTKEVVREVPILVPASRDADYPLSNGFVCSHEAAVASCNGEPAPAPCGAPEAPSEVGASTYAAVVASNYGACAEYAERVRQWEQFYADLRARWNHEVGP